MDFLKDLENRGAILKGHFLLTSGLHSNTYFEKFSSGYLKTHPSLYP